MFHDLLFMHKSLPTYGFGTVQEIPQTKELTWLHIDKDLGHIDEDDFTAVALKLSYNGANLRR